jgi:hypothetical protein
MLILRKASMIKCTFRDLIQLRDINDVPGPFSKLRQADNSLSLVERVRVARFLKPLLTETAAFEQHHLELLEKYGTRRKDNPNLFDIATEDDGKGGRRLNESRLREFKTEQEKLYEMECEVAILPLTQTVYGKLPLTPNDFMALEKFLVLPDAE